MEGNEDNSVDTICNGIVAKTSVDLIRSGLFEFSQT